MMRVNRTRFVKMASGRIDLKCMVKICIKLAMGLLPKLFSRIILLQDDLVIRLWIFNHQFKCIMDHEQNFEKNTSPKGTLENTINVHLHSGENGLR